MFLTENFFATESTRVHGEGIAASGGLDMNTKEGFRRVGRVLNGLIVFSLFLFILLYLIMDRDLAVFAVWYFAFAAFLRLGAWVAKGFAEDREKDAEI